MTKPISATQDYKKEDLVTSLKEAKTRVEATLDTYEQDLTNWRASSVEKFTKQVSGYNPDKSTYFPTSGFEPPHKPRLCESFQVRELNRTIARIGLVDGDTIKLRADDPIWQWIGMGECE